MFYTYDERRTTTLLHKYNSTLLFSKGVKASVMCEGDRRAKRDKDRLPHWLTTSSFDNITLCYLQGPTRHFFLLPSRPHPALFLLLSSGGSLWAAASTGYSRWLQAETPRLPLTHVSICIYHFVTPTHFRSTMWLRLLIFTCLSCLENLWSTARSKVNM